MASALTVRDVESARPKDTAYRLHDARLPGLSLRVLPSGVKSWSVTWAHNRERAIGKYPVVTLDGARAKARALLAEVDQHGAPLAVIEAGKPASAAPITLRDFVDQHFRPWALANQKAGQATVDALAACFVDLYGRELRGIVAFDLEQFKTARLNAEMKPATVNRDLDRIRKVFTCAVEWGFIDKHPMGGKRVKRLKVDNERVRYLSAPEDKRLRKALANREAERRKERQSGNAWREARGMEPLPLWPADSFTDHLMPMVLLALKTGLRRGELFGLEWRSVNIKGKMLTVVASSAKSGKTRHVPLNVEALDVVKRWKNQGSADGLVFPAPTGGRFTNINKAWAGLVKSAKLVDFHFHDCRHDFASKLVMAGVDLNTVRELLGHADIKMTLRYAHLAPVHLAGAVARI